MVEEKKLNIDLSLNKKTYSKDRSLLKQIISALGILFTFLSAVLSINTIQFFGFPLRFIPGKRAHKYSNKSISYTKNLFCILILLVNSIWAPTKFRIGGDSSMFSNTPLTSINRNRRKKYSAKKSEIILEKSSEKSLHELSSPEKDLNSNSIKQRKFNENYFNKNLESKDNKEEINETDLDLKQKIKKYSPFWINSKGELKSNLGRRLIMIANHQLYADWIYLWIIAGTSGMGGALVIMLKESLKYIPLLGWGMQYFKFIFLSRKWTKDKTRMHDRLMEISDRRKDGKNPAWVLLFPEGTNMSGNTKARSDSWAEKINVASTNRVLLPRITGLYYCLSQLREHSDMEYLYDVTIGYEGAPTEELLKRSMYPLREMYLQGKFPPNVSLYFQRYKISEIPVTEDEFSEWLMQIWRKKDKMMNHYVKTGWFVDKELAENDLPIIEWQISVNLFKAIFKLYGVLLVLLFIIWRLWVF